MKILIGYDGSKTADEALQDMRKAGLPAAAQAFVLTAAPPLLPMDYLGSDPAGSALYVSTRIDYTTSSKEMEAEAKVISGKGARTLGRLYPGWKIAAGTSGEVPAQAILAKANAWKPDLIVLGSHGWSGFGGLLLGSVADQVFRHAHANVRVARKGVRKGAGAPRLLVGYDGSPHAEAAVSEIMRRRWPKGTQLTLLAATAMQVRIGEVSRTFRNTLNLKTSKADLMPWLERVLDKAALRLGKRGLMVTPMLRVADPRKALLDEAKKMSADCIFVGSRGLSGLKRFLVGSVSTAVAAHAPCSVEVIHALPGIRK